MKREHDLIPRTVDGVQEGTWILADYPRRRPARLHARGARVLQARGALGRRSGGASSKPPPPASYAAGPFRVRTTFAGEAGSPPTARPATVMSRTLGAAHPHPEPRLHREPLRLPLLEDALEEDGARRTTLPDEDPAAPAGRGDGRERRLRAEPSASPSSWRVCCVAGAATLPPPVGGGCAACLGGVDDPPSRQAASPATAAPSTTMEASVTSTLRWTTRRFSTLACGTSDCGSSSWRAIRALYSSM